MNFPKIMITLIIFRSLYPFFKSSVFLKILIYMEIFDLIFHIYFSHISVRYNFHKIIIAIKSLGISNSILASLIFLQFSTFSPLMTHVQYEQHTHTHYILQIFFLARESDRGTSAFPNSRRNSRNASAPSVASFDRERDATIKARRLHGTMWHGTMWHGTA